MIGHRRLLSETSGVLTVRRATPADATFLREVLAIAADWRPESPVRSVAEIMRESALAHYITGWPIVGDIGFVAEDDHPLGAAWWRFFPVDDPGYGFVDDATPEVSIGLRVEARGRGIGTLLLEALVEEAWQRDIPTLSLSVEPDNPAFALYERLGFVAVGRRGGAVTMVLTRLP